MMTELSLHVLDIVQNSIVAKATRIELSITIHTTKNTLMIQISDNGCGMDEEELKKILDPFYTTRTTRKVGLGIPFFKYSAEITGGNLHITSKKGTGTKLTATYILNHIDRMPLGDMVSTIHTLITCNTNIDFLYHYNVDDVFFKLDTRELRAILEDIPFHLPEVSNYIKEYLTENTLESNKGNFF